MFTQPDQRNSSPGVGSITDGRHHSLALKTNGTVVAWGSKGDGQAKVPAKTKNVTAISVGGAHNLVLVKK